MTVGSLRPLDNVKDRGESVILSSPGHTQALHYVFLKTTGSISTPGTTSCLLCATQIENAAMKRTLHVIKAPIKFVATGSLETEQEICTL